MHKKILLMLAIATFARSTCADVYTADIRQTLYYLLTQTDEHTLIVCNADISDMITVYEKPHKDIEHELKIALKEQRKDAEKLRMLVKQLMQTINPIYIAAAKMVPNVIGITRRSLRWAHYVNQACNEQEICNAPERLAIAVPSANGNKDEMKEIECNANIIYLENTHAAHAVHQYRQTRRPDCTRIVLVDTDEATLRTWSLGLAELQAPPVTVILVQQ